MVTSVTYNNHMDLRTNKCGDYIVRMGKCARTPHSFNQEALNAARLIKEQAGEQDIWISYSGGIDSEFIIHTFLAAEIKFKVATAVMKHQENAYDLEHSRKFCKLLGLPLHEVVIDINSFLATELDHYATETKCVSPQFPVHMKLWDQLDGFIVAGHGDPIFKRVNNIWMFNVQEKEDSVYRYAKWRNRNMAPGFFAYTPELLLSFILEKEVSNMFITGKSAKINDIIQIKHNVYSKYYNISKREKKTGFEEINKLDDYYRNKLLTMFPDNNRKFSNPVENLIDQLWPRIDETDEH